MKMKVDNTSRINYEKSFNDKINMFKGHKKYNWLRECADESLIFHGDYGWNGIGAKDFIDRIIKMELDYIQDWLDGKNGLEWQ